MAKLLSLRPDFRYHETMAGRCRVWQRSVAVLFFGGTLAVHGADAYLTNVQQSLDLGRGGGQRPSAMVPAQLQGVVTFAFEGVRSIFVQDATGGIQVNYTNSDVRAVAGQLVEVSG